MTAPGAGGPGLLFVSYDGVLGGPGRSQVLPYLRGYAEAGWQVRLISYEKPDLLADAARRRDVEEALGRPGIAWTPLVYTRSMARDLLAGLAAVAGATLRERPRVVHARSYVPALLGLLAAKPLGARLLFDMRGFWPDERVDGGLWTRRHPLFALWKGIERVLLRAADGVVSISHEGLRVLAAEGLLPASTPRAVIPCGADLERFRPSAAGEAPADLRPFLGKHLYTFLGATGTWYLLPEMLDFAAEAVRAEPDARVLFLTEDDGAAVRDGLAARGVPPDRFLVARAPHGEVPRWIGPSRAGVFFIRSCRSKRASCPTKLGEFLACGVPVVINEGVGDTAGIVRGAGVGVVVERLGPDGYREARRALAALHDREGLRDRCRAEAVRTFDAAAGAREFAGLAARIARA